MLFEILAAFMIFAVFVMVETAGAFAMYALGRKAGLEEAQPAKAPAEEPEKKQTCQGEEDRRTRHFEDVLANIEAYDGTTTGQREVTPL